MAPSWAWFFCFHALWHSIIFSCVFCTPCKVEFAFAISWPCRAPVPRWSCHPQSQTLGFDRWIWYAFMPNGTLRLGSATSFWRVSFPWCRSCSFAQADGPPASMSGFIQLVLAGLSPWSSTVLSQYTILIPQVCFGVNSNSSPLAVPSQNGCRKKPETIELLFWNRYTDKAPDTQKY